MCVFTVIKDKLSSYFLLSLKFDVNPKLHVHKVKHT